MTKEELLRAEKGERYSSYLLTASVLIIFGMALVFGILGVAKKPEGTDLQIILVAIAGLATAMLSLQTQVWRNVKNELRFREIMEKIHV